MNKLGAIWEPTEWERAYKEGRSTQVPVNAVVRIKGRFARQLGYVAILSCSSDSVNYDPAEILAAQEHFGFARPTAIEKDWHILRAMGAIASTDAAPFKFVFAGGPSLGLKLFVPFARNEGLEIKRP